MPVQLTVFMGLVDAVLFPCEYKPVRNSASPPATGRSRQLISTGLSQSIQRVYPAVIKQQLQFFPLEN